MAIIFFLAAIILGLVAGAGLGYESRFLRDQPEGWRPWIVFSVVIGVGVVCSALVNHINETDPPSTSIKGLSILAGAVAFSISMFIARNRR
jgi:drug/metabolite transporter (DMT)-like permease